MPAMRGGSEAERPSFIRKISGASVSTGPVA
jgi:hypothetical protein